jgi:uncharacterized integral membrane protein
MNLKLILGAFLILTVVILSVQNAGVVEVKIFGWSFLVSLALVIFVALGIGFIGGWAVTGAVRLKRRRRKDPPVEAPHPPPPDAS